MSDQSANEGIQQSGGAINAGILSVGRGASVSVTGHSAESADDDAQSAAILQRLTILFLAANPRDTSPLRLSEEIRTIQERTQACRFRDRIDVSQHWAVRFSDLQPALLSARANVVHFSGHGDSEGRIVAEDAAGLMKSLSLQSIQDLFRILKNDVRCVILNACHSYLQARAIADIIDVVVGMSSAIDDAAAIHFAEGFYLGLGNGCDTKMAYDLGCNAIELSGSAGYTLPQLYYRAEVDPSKIVLLGP